MAEKKMSKQELLEKYQAEFTDWLSVLEKYHNNRFTTNYRQYTAYADTEGTETRISDPVAPEMVERIIKRLFPRDPKFFAMARGKNLPKEVIDVMSSVADYYWTNPETIQKSGTMLSRLKVFGREFCILGNGAVETFFNTKTNNPDMRVVPIEDVIFDPTRTLKTSPVYYIRNFVTIDYLKENAEITKEGKTYGLFKNIDEIEKLVEGTKKPKDDSSSNRINRSGSDLYDRSIGSITLISRYEGNKTCRFITNLGDKSEKNVLIQEYVNDVLDDDPLDFAMDIEVLKQPYAFGTLDFLNGLTHAKDLLLNQMIDYGSKVLNPPLFVDPSLAPINRASLANAWKLGGLVFASPQQADHKTMPPLGNFGFDLMNYIQQRAEASSDNGGYLGGTPNQASDKTQGTATGVQTLIQQSQPTIQDRQRNIEESVIEPIINKWIKMSAALMNNDEIKYVFISGQSPRWVKATKGLLTGKIKLADLMEAELLNEMEVQEMVGTMIENGQDPNNDLLFDVDWIIRVETGSMAEADKEEELRNFDTTMQAGQAMGLPLDTQKIWVERAMKAGIKEPEQYLKSPEQLAQEQQNMPPMIGGVPVEGLGGQNGTTGIPAMGGAQQAAQGIGQAGSLPNMA